MAIEIGPALGLTADSSSLALATQDLKNITTAAGGAEAAAAKLAGGTKAVAGGMSKVANQSRMVAQQLSQVGQQTMATGNFVQALAIQLPDMALGFGAVGIAAGVLAGVALPLVAQWLGGTAAKAVELKDALGSLSDIQSNLSASQDIMAMSLVELYEKYGLYALSIRNAAAALTELQVVEAQAALADTLLQSASALDRIADASARGLVAVAKDMGMTVGQALALQGAFQKVRDAASFEDKVASLQNLDRQLKNAGLSASILPEEMRKAVAESYNATIKMGELKRASDLAAQAASAISRNVPKSGWLDGAINGASRLAATLWDAAAAKAAATGGVPGQRDNMDYGNSDWSKTSLGFTSSNLAYQPPNTSKGGGGGGGGGGASDRQSGIDSLVGELRTEQETLDAWRAENLAKIAEYNNTELAAIGGQNEAKIRLEAEYQERLRAIVDSEKNYRLTETSNMFGALATIAEAGGKKSLKAQAVLSAAATMIAGYEAAMKAAAEAKTIAGRIAAYATFVGMGLKAAAAIRSAGGVGGGGGGAAQTAGNAGSSTTNTTAPDTPLRVSLDAIDQNAVYSGGAIMKMFDAIQKEAGNRGIIWVADGASA